MRAAARHPYGRFEGARPDGGAAIGHGGSTLPPVPPPLPDTSCKSIGWQLATFDFSGTSEVGKMAAVEVSLTAGDGQLGTWAYDAQDGAGNQTTR